MVKEILGYLNLGPGNIVLDATIGTGGHSKEMLERIRPQGKLIGIDRDEESLDVCRSRLSEYKDSCIFVHGNFVDIDTILRDLNIESIDGILFDLGISSYQLEDSQRGFSFKNEGPLDMRLDRSSYISAYDLVNNLNEEEISSLLWNFGQERFHNRIARILVNERQKHPITTTSQLSDIVFKALPYRYRHSHHKIHPATRTFQAVRIAVNRELEILENALSKSIKLLNKGARICVISFHSLEDRIVKLTFRKFAAENTLTLITPKPLTPMPQEIEANPSSRSAKLRVAQRT